MLILIEYDGIEAIQGVQIDKFALYHLGGNVSEWVDKQSISSRSDVHVWILHDFVTLMWSRQKLCFTPSIEKHLDFEYEQFVVYCWTLELLKHGLNGCVLEVRSTSIGAISALGRETVLFLAQSRLHDPLLIS